MLEPFEKGLVGTTLRYPYEVRDTKDYFDEIPDIKVAPESRIEPLWRISRGRRRGSRRLLSLHSDRLNRSGRRVKLIENHESYNARNTHKENECWARFGKRYN
jgi:hypothetical protein